MDYVGLISYHIQQKIMMFVRKFCMLVVVYYLAIVFASWALIVSIIGMIRHGRKYFLVNSRSKPPAVLSNPVFGNHAYLALKQVKIHYVEIGDKTKPLLLLVHGFPEFWYSWRFQLQEFARDYWVVAIDLRGYGDSDKPSGLENYRVNVLVQDLKEIINGLGREKCILAGHDWGGALAWYQTLINPDMVEKLIIMNAPHPQAFQKHIQSSLKQLFMSHYMFCFQFPKFPEMLLTSNDLEIFERLFKHQIKDRENFTDEDLEAFKYTFSQPNAFTPPLNYYRNIFKKELGQPLSFPKITVPVLIIWGTKDVALDVKLAELSAQHVEKCTVKLIPNASHWVQQDAYQVVNDTMREFLNVPIGYSQGLVRKMKRMKKQLVSSVNGVMKLGEIMKPSGKLARTSSYIATTVGRTIITSSFNVVCGVSGIPVESLHGFVMLN